MKGLVINRKSTLLASVVSACMVLCTTVLADDTEIYFSRKNASSNTAANVLFVLDNSGSMLDFDPPFDGSRRLDKMKSALLNVLSNTNNVNIGMGTFNGSDKGGNISFPVTHIDKDLCPDANCTRVDAYALLGAGTDDARELDEDPKTADTTASFITLGKFYDKENKTGTNGIRFVGLNVPRGATILSASIEFDSQPPDSIANGDFATLTEVTNGAASFTVTGEAVGDALPYAPTNGNLTSRPPTTASVNWVPGKWGTNPYLRRSADLAPIVEEIVKRADWCGGNSIAFQISGTGVRISKSRDGNAYTAPKLRVTYDPTTVNFDDTCLTKTIVASVAAGSDDAVEDTASGSVNIASTDIDLNVATETQLNGYRFSDVAVPQGATISNAYLELQASKDHTGDVSLSIKGNAIDDAMPFASVNGSLSGLTPTGAEVLWPALPALTTDKRIKSPNIKSIVQELVSQPGWTSGNAIGLVTSVDSGTDNRAFHAYESSPSASARLHIEYELSSSSTDIPAFYTAREKLSQIVHDFYGYERTPLLDAYYEGVLYMMGKPMLNGNKRGAGDVIDRYFRLSHEDSYLGGTLNRPAGCTVDDLDNPDCAPETIDGSATYVSPIDSACQANQLILLSDGSPNENNIVTPANALMSDTPNCVSDGDETCGRELAAWLNSNDVSPSVPGTQTITTSTVGFHFSGSILSDMAENGGGDFFEAESSTELTRAFQNIFNGIADIDTSFVAPSISVNESNRLTTRDDIYFSLFKPSKTPHWKGNLKRYKLGVATGDASGKINILDMNNKVAVDELTGLFKTESKSFWSATADGAAVEEGGAASKLLQYRNLYTYLDNDLTSTSIDLNNATVITKDILGINGESDQHHDDLLDWVTGMDVKDADNDNDTFDARMVLGDPLHSTPIVMNYNNGAPNSVIFFGTNEGILHAVNTANGAELSGIIPPLLLPNLNLLYNNRGTTSHPYGLDGPSTAWIKNDNGNLIVDSGETAYLTIGMRRGGNRYYTFDITDPYKPQLAWEINPSQAGFGDLGQTWSTPIKTLVNVGGTMIDALIFAGGYDESNDSKVVRGDDAKGNAIYIVDAADGDLIWHYDSNKDGNMKYSIPSDIRVIDLDLDGAADRAYVGDMGGQIWRFDFDNRSDGAGFTATAGLIADLNDGSVTGNRRFFYEPDVALVNEEGQDFLAISIGSGWRAHPLDEEVRDRFYSLRDYDVFGRPKDEFGVVSYTTLMEVNLEDATTYDPNNQPVVNDGWYIELDRNGEKVLSEAITINNQIVFTSYYPETDVLDCVSAVGFGSLYVVDVFNAAPTIDLDPGDPNSELSSTDRRVNLDTPGIPSKPTTIFPDGAKPIVIVGTEQKLPDIDFGPLTRQTYWAEQIEE